MKHRSNTTSADRTEASESSSRQPKTQTSDSEIMVYVFWDAHGILFIDCLKIGKIISNEY